jgi:hypothetical protein
MNKPTAAPTKKLPPKETNKPPKTSDKPESCKAKPKAKLAVRAPQAPAVDESKYQDEKPMSILVRTAKRPSDAWKNGDRWAILEKYPPKNILKNPLPDHYRLIIGTIVIEPIQKEVKDCNGEVTGHKEILDRKFVARPYDRKS